MNPRDRVMVLKDGRERGGSIVEIQRDTAYWSPLSQGEPPVVAVRVWLDGEAQPEQIMRKRSEVWA